MTSLSIHPIHYPTLKQKVISWTQLYEIAHTFTEHMMIENINTIYFIIYVYDYKYVVIICKDFLGLIIGDLLDKIQLKY